MDTNTSQHNGSGLPYGSTFKPPPLPPPNPVGPHHSAVPIPGVPPNPGLGDPLKPRGGVQVLPPVVPPRGPVKSKPRPPVPPKRDQLTRLTTVPMPPPRDEAKSLEALERKINSASSPPNKPVRKPNYENTYQMEPPPPPPPSTFPDNRRLSNSGSHSSFKDSSFKDSSFKFSPKESSSEEEGATADIWVRAIDSPVKKPERMFRSNSTTEEKETKAKLVHRASIDNAFIKSPPLKKVPQKPQAIAEQKENDDKPEDSRPEETPFPKFEENIFLKNDEKLSGDRSFFKANYSLNKQDDKLPPPPMDLKCPSVADTSLPPLPKFDEESLPRPDVDVVLHNDDESDTERSRVELEKMKIDGREGGLKVGLDGLPGSRPGSRATSRSSSPYGEKERKKVSAAEALGVIAKPCPRPPPGKRTKTQVEFRRQSLGNLSDSKLSMGCSTSCPSHQLWSSFGECQENEIRRHERTRGQSADSRTLQRLKSDSWETQSYSSTLSRIGKYSTSKYFAKTTCADRSAACPAAANPGSGERPKSVCNCGRHTTGSVPSPRDVGKRTFSVEELRSGGFVRGSSTTGSARSSFGKSPRVTFALSEDEGASGGSGGGGDPRRMSGRARSYDADDRFQNNRSQPPSALKQTPKARSLSQSTPPGVTNGSDVPHSQDASPPQDNVMMFREGNLVSGRLDALVQHLVPSADYYPDRAFLFAFLLTSRLFIKPHDLLRQILALSDAQFKSKQSSPKEKAAMLPRLVQLLGEWSETFPYDFRDERVMSHVRDVAHRCVSVEGPVRQEVSLLLHNLLYRLKKLEQYEAFLHSIHTEATTSSLEALSQTDVNELCGSAESLAQQLTHIELERLSYIGPEEFVQAFAKESPALETSFKDMKQTRNLESYVSWFNRLSYFVATEVCKHIKSKKQRVRVVEFWVETARECFNIGNFNSLMAIIAGLNMSPVSRLKRTWSKVQCAKFSVLEHQMDPSCNFSSYRSTLKAAVWRAAAATDDSQRIVIPFFSLLVKDLYFLNEGCSNKLPNGHINFEKFWQLAKQVTEFITWKQVHCPFPKAAKVITYLQATPVLNEDALALASFECEQPENHEKERYKSLKAELEKSTSN